MSMAKKIFWGSVAGLVHTHVTYPLTLAALERLRGPRAQPAPATAGGQPTVSLIVAAYDEEEVIAAKVANALALDYPRERLELIVASDGSADATAERARAAGADLVLELPRGGKVAAQNAAAEQADGRDPRLLRRQQRLGARTPCAAWSSPSPTPRSATSAARSASSTPRATTSRAPTGATRWRCARWSRRSPGSPPATARSTRSARDAYLPLAPSGSHDLSLPLRARQARPALALRRRRRAPRRRWCRRSRASSPANGG